MSLDDDPGNFPGCQGVPTDQKIGTPDVVAPKPDNFGAGLAMRKLRYWVIPLRAAGEQKWRKNKDDELEPVRDENGEIEEYKGKEPFTLDWGLSYWDDDKFHRGFYAVSMYKKFVYTTRHEGRGLGVCLGPGRGPGGGDLADFEGDGEQAQTSMAILLGTDELPFTPSWWSARGGHFLFIVDHPRLLSLLLRAGAREKEGRNQPGVFYLPGLPDLEFRIGGHFANGKIKQLQSVIPPTVGDDGKPRAWIVEPTAEVVPLPLPEHAYQVLERLGDEEEARRALLPPEERAAPRVAVSPVEGARRDLELAHPTDGGPDADAQLAVVIENAGLAYSLPEEEVVRLLMEGYVARCRPPWEEVAIKDAVRDVYEKAAEEGRPRGWLVGKERAAGGGGTALTPEQLAALTGEPPSLSPQLEKRVLAYMETIEGGVSGGRGSFKTYGALCRVGLWFDLPEEQTFRLFWRNYNHKCKPAWSPEELWRKVSEVYANAKPGERGKLLDPGLPAIPSWLSVDDDWSSEGVEEWKEIDPSEVQWAYQDGGLLQVASQANGQPAEGPGDGVNNVHGIGIFEPEEDPGLITDNIRNKPPSTDLTPIAAGLVEAMADPGAASLHVAPTGAGKSYAIALTLSHLYRRGRKVAAILGTLQLVAQVLAHLRRMCPEAIAANAVVLACGRQAMSPGDEDDPGDVTDSEEGTYAINAWSKLILTTHAGVGRRGWSRYIRILWESLGGFDLIVDEVSLFIANCRWTIPCGHRYRSQANPDGVGLSLVPQRRCPKSAGSGNCGNCTKDPCGGEVVFNGYRIRELVPPRRIEIAPGAQGDVKLRTRHRPLLDLHDRLGQRAWVKVAMNTLAAEIVSFDGELLDPCAREKAAIYYFKQEDGLHPAETDAQILAHLMTYAHAPCLTVEMPVRQVKMKGQETKWLTTDPGILKEKLAKGDKDWAKDIRFPHFTCEFARLLFTDLYALETMRRHVATHQTAVSFVGANPLPADRTVIQHVFPDLDVREYAYMNSKIEQLAVIAYVGDDSALRTWVDDKGRPLTSRLEKHGPGMLFFPTKRLAQEFFDLIKAIHPSARFVVENREEWYMHSHIRPDPDGRCMISYSRGVVGVGVNVLGLRWLVLDCSAFRAISSFNPTNITKESFKVARAEERLALLHQNLGRILRGEPGKTACLILLNDNVGDEDAPTLFDGLKKSQALLDSCVQPPLFLLRESRTRIIGEASAWLDKAGGEWPKLPPEMLDEDKKAGRPKRSKDDIIKDAEEAIANGVAWREFRNKSRPERVLDEQEMADLKARFTHP
jgi:hypothetical protein